MEPRDGETLAKFVERGIEALFQDVAEVFGSSSCNNMTEDEVAGVPMAIFAASLCMIDAWRNHVAGTRAEEVRQWPAGREE